MPCILSRARFIKRLVLDTYKYNLHCFFYNILYCAVCTTTIDANSFFSALINLHKPYEFFMISDTYIIIIWFKSENETNLEMALTESTPIGSQIKNDYGM